MGEKISSTVIGVSTTAPATYDKAGFEAMQESDWTDIDCQMTSMGNITLEFDTSTGESVFCNASGTPLTVEDLDDLKAQPWEISGLHATDSVFQDTVETIFFSKSEHYVRVKHPNGTDVMWFKVKQKKFSDDYGDSKAERKFSYAYILRDIPKKS